MISVYKFYAFAADLNNGDYLAKQRQMTDLRGFNMLKKTNKSN
jgi:hypothetical protein